MCHAVYIVQVGNVFLPKPCNDATYMSHVDTGTITGNPHQMPMKICWLYAQHLLQHLHLQCCGQLKKQ